MMQRIRVEVEAEALRALLAGERASREVEANRLAGGRVVRRVGRAKAQRDSLAPKGYPPGLRAQTVVALEGQCERRSSGHEGLETVP